MRPVDKVLGVESSSGKPALQREARCYQIHIVEPKVGETLIDGFCDLATVMPAVSMMLHAGNYRLKKADRRTEASW